MAWSQAPWPGMRAPSIKEERPMTFTRRSFGLAALGGAVLPALPAPPRRRTIAGRYAGIYRTKIGALRSTVLNDGTGGDPESKNYYSGTRPAPANCCRRRLRPGRGPDHVQRWLV